MYKCDVISNITTVHSLLHVERFCPDKIQIRLSFTSIHQPVDNCLNRTISYMGCLKMRYTGKRPENEGFFGLLFFISQHFSTVSPSGNFPQLWNVYEKMPYSWMILLTVKLYDLPYLVGGLEHEFYFSIYWE